jgi:hypothetical protein
MLSQSEVKFEAPIPLPEIIIEKLIVSTGLSDISLVKDVYYKLVHHLFPEVGFVFFEIENRYILLYGDNKIRYMSESLISVLISLGGYHPHQLLNWAGKKWDDVKHLFGENGVLRGDS